MKKLLLIGTVIGIITNFIFVSIGMLNNKYVKEDLGA